MVTELRRTYFATFYLGASEFPYQEPLSALVMVAKENSEKKTRNKMAEVYLNFTTCRSIQEYSTFLVPAKHFFLLMQMRRCIFLLAGLNIKDFAI